MPVSFRSSRVGQFLMVCGAALLAGVVTESQAQCPGGACGSRCPSCGPVFVPPPMAVAPPRYQPNARPAQPMRSAGNSRYLPPMPEMLKNRTPAHALPALASAGTRQPDKASVAPDQPRPVIRAQNGDLREPSTSPNSLPPRKLHLPSPEELGLLSESDESSSSAVPSKSVNGSADWNTTRERLEQWGATHYRLERVEQGWRFVCVLPHPRRSDAQHQIEVEAPTDGAAMTAVLERAETWLKTLR